MNFWRAEFLAAAVALTLCASAHAAPKTFARAQQSAAKTERKLCYTYISGSANPQPCERMRGAAPTTTIPIVVIRYR